VIMLATDARARPCSARVGVWSSGRSKRTCPSPTSIEIPAGTQTGQRFRLRKRGLPLVAAEEKERRGDLFVEVRVWVPTVADDASRELLREFERRNPHDPRQESGLWRYVRVKG